MFKAEVVDDMKNGEAREVIRGEGRRAITFQLAQEYRDTLAGEWCVCAIFTPLIRRHSFTLYRPRHFM